MQGLIKTLEAIEDKCNDKKRKEREKKEEDLAKLDEFTRMKKKIAHELSETRKEIEERNALLEKTENNAATVKMSSHIRNKLKAIFVDTEQLKAIVEKEKEKIEKKKSKGKSVPEEKEKEIVTREEITELCFKHIEECKHLERAGTVAKGSVFVDNSKPSGSAPSELPDIPDDEGFVQLRKKDAIIEKKLEKVGEGVLVLRDMANEMGKEIDKQGVMLDNLDKSMNKTQATLDNLNKRLKAQLAKVRTADRFIIDIILLIIVLAIGLYIYNLARNK